jgi:hypothetical protein
MFAGRRGQPRGEVVKVRVKIHGVTVHPYGLRHGPTEVVCRHTKSVKCAAMEILSPPRLTLASGLQTGDDIAFHDMDGNVFLVFLEQLTNPHEPIGVDWRRVSMVAVGDTTLVKFTDGTEVTLNTAQKLVFRVRFHIDPWDLSSIEVVEHIADRLTNRPQPSDNL